MKVFVEEQRFNQWWIYVIFAIPLLAPFLAFLFNANYNNSQEVNAIGISVSFIVVLIMAVLISLIRLKTKINENGIYYQFFPLQLNKKFIPWRNISKCYVRKYSPILDYGGWGYKRPFGKNRALNIRGNYGIQLVFISGRKLLIGTQNINEAKQVLLTYNHKIIQDEN